MKESLPPFNQWTMQQNDDVASYDCFQDDAETAIHYLHGNGFCGATLVPLAQTIHSHSSNSYCHLVTDIPGHGQSPIANTAVQPDWNAMAEHIATSLQQRWKGPLIGIGHSLGGVLTLIMAAEKPALFKRIILLDPVMFTPTVIFAQRFLRKSGWWKNTSLVKQVSRRRHQWPSHKAMATSLCQKRLYRDWHKLAFENFIHHASNQQPDGSVRLSCDPSWEASIFASYPRRLWSLIRQVQVPVEIVVANKTYPFIDKSASKAMAINPLINVTYFGQDHCFPMTHPKETIQHIGSLSALCT